MFYPTLDTLGWLNIAVMALVSYGILVQWKHIHRRRTPPHDIVTKEVVIRYAATMVVLIKLISIHDFSLITGQVMLAIVMTIYLFTLLELKNKK